MKNLPDWIQAGVVVIALCVSAVSLYTAVQMNIEVLQLKVVEVEKDMELLGSNFRTMVQEAQDSKVRIQANEMTIGYIVQGYEELSDSLKGLTLATQQLSIDIKTK